MKKIKLAVFDMEGTIFQKSYRMLGGKEFPSAWAVLCELCGQEAAARDEQNRKKHHRIGHIPGSYPYSRWVVDTVKIHQEFGLTKRQFDEVINSVDYFPGVTETFATLKRLGITIAVISGGLKALVDRVALDHQIEHCFAAAEYFWNSDGKIAHWNVMPTDFEHKKTLLEIICRDLGIKRSECAFIGDGKNDREIAEHAGLSIGFNPHEILKKSTAIVIEQDHGKEDLSAVLQPIMQYPFFAKDNFARKNVWQLR